MKLRPAAGARPARGRRRPRRDRSERGPTSGGPDSLSGVKVRPLGDADHPWVIDLCRRQSGADNVTAWGRLHRAARLPGLVAWEAERRVGALEAQGRRSGWERLRLVVRNDNTPALRFYRRRGRRLVALHVGAVNPDRPLKREIPGCGVDGIPIRDALEPERPLTPGEERG